MSKNMDLRKDYLLGILEKAFELKIVEDDKLKFHEDSCVSNFLDNLNFLLLTCTKKDKFIQCSNQIISSDSSCSLIFFKIKNEPIKVDNLQHNIFVSSMIHSPLRTIYYYILRVYTPLLKLNSSDIDANIDPKLQKLFKDLENRLRSILLQQSKSEAASLDQESPADILTLLDEVNYWKYTNDKQGLIFANLLEPLAVKYMNLNENSDFTSIDDKLDYTFNVLDDVWKARGTAFPEPRMENILDIIGTDIVAVIQWKFKDFDFWRDDLKITDEPLRNAISVCEKWIHYSKDLTSLYWPNYESHRWRQKMFIPEHLSLFVNRLRQVHSILTINYKFKILFDEEDQKKFSLNTFFSPFKGLNTLSVNEYTESNWNDALTSYESKLSVLDREAALRLKTVFQEYGYNMLQLFQVFKNYEELLERPLIQNMILPERQSLLEQINYYISTMNPRGESDSVAAMDIPQTVANLIKARQDEEKIAFIISGKNLLSDLSGYNDLLKSIESIRDELREYQNGQFSSWTLETSTMLRMKGIGLRPDDVVIHFEEGKLMSVNFSKRLVSLIRETRQLKALGYPIDSEIIDAAEKAQSCIAYAKELNKIATFHNTIGDHIIRSQKGMMLKTARELAKLVQSQHAVTWKNLKIVEEYIRKLQNVVQRLAKENHKLGQCHYTVMKMVSQLIEHNLYNETNFWNGQLRNIRNIVDEVEKEFSNSLAWKNHIDWQIYKIMECQYRTSLLGISSFISDISVELYISEGTVKCRPSLSQLKSELLRKLKVSILYPKSVTYFGDDNVYVNLIDYNASRTDVVFQQGCLIFDKLQNFIKSIYEWSALSSINLDEFISTKINTAQDWESNLKTSKFLAQELAKFSRQPHKIECFIISMDRLLHDLESENSKCWKKLSAGLRSEILSKITILEAFVRNALSIINEVPVTVEDYIDIYYKHQQMLDEKNKKSVLLNEIENNHEVLKTWTGEVMSQSEDIKVLWTKYQSTLITFNSTFTKNTESLKQNLLDSYNLLRDEIKGFSLKWSDVKPKSSNILPDDSIEAEHYFTVISSIKDEWVMLCDRMYKIRNDFQKFNMDEPDFFEFASLENEIKEYEHTWTILQEFRSDVKNLADQEWIVIRKVVVKKIEFFLNSWEERASKLTYSAVILRINQGLEHFQGIIPYLKFLIGETFTEKHWHEIFNLFGRPYKPPHEIKFGDILFSVSEIEDNINELKEINNRAAAEVVIRQALSELDIWELEVKFSTIVHCDSLGVQINLIKDFKGIMNKIGDNQSLLLSINGAAGSEQFIDRIALWDKKLTEVDQHLKHLSQVQQRWVYLEPILNRSSLEKERFFVISKEFKSILYNISKYDYRVTSILKINNLARILENLLTQLEQCQKSLLNFLEEKRLKFPRFYFISDGDLLEMLGQPNKTEVLQSHLKKVFPGIHTVIFDDNKVITGVTSSQGEVVELKKSIHITENIEVWLESLGEEMKQTLKVLTLECLDHPDPVKYPSQILCLTEQIRFTKRCEDSIRSKTLKKFLDEVMRKYQEYTSQMMSLHTGKSGVRSTLLTFKLKSLLIDSIYYIRVLNSLIEKNVTTLNDWNWEKYMRFYLNDHHDIIIKIADATFDYSYEYQGNQPKLVHTSLTDKCYLTLTQALHMGFGGNPFGPAGTGKTESVKSLGALLGRQVLVFNCDEGLDAQSLIRIMVGIVKCGAWGCFDEFNRLDEKTLSLISLQISEIQNALKSKLKSVKLLNKQVEVNMNSGIFITLNPAGKGYGGRQKLPESLKSLFRSVVMSKPDDIDIASVILHCEGYKFAEKIALKLVTLFNMARDILTNQSYYDWGLRALKTVVNGCGQFLKEYLKDHNSASEEIEFKLVLQAVQLNTLCKLTYSDGNQFIQLLKDVFPGIDISPASNENLKKGLQQAFHDLKLIYNERQAEKCLELLELLKQRMGVVIVGPASSGKSTIITLLKQVLIMGGAIIRHDVLNPKCISRTELLGYIDLDTRQWNDGVLTRIAQEVYNEQEGITCWIHCDGDVDPEWIESLNSVLDDNHLLTLPSGWRIHFGENVHFIFETHDLKHASPATISRMGIVFLSNEDVKPEMVIDSWLCTLQDSEFKDFLSKTVFSALSWIREYGKFQLNVPLMSTIKSCLGLLDNVNSKKALAVALMNGLGSNLYEESKEQFFSFVLDLIDEVVLNKTNVINYYYYDEDNDCISPYGFDRQMSLQSYELVSVPYMNVAMDIVTYWLHQQKPLVIVGPSGSGKRSLIRDCLKSVYNSELITIECNPRLSSSHVKNVIHDVCSLVTSKSGRIYRPRNTERFIIHFAHINLLHMDKWGSRMVIEFLKQTTQDKGFYDDNLEWVSLENVNFIYTVTSLDKIASRFLSSNHILYIRSPITSEMNYIYSKCLKDYHPYLEKPFDISTLMVSICQEVENSFTGSSNVLSFSPRNLSKWCQNISRYGPVNKDTFSEAFLNESRRIFKDKLTTEKHLGFEKNMESKLNHQNSPIVYSESKEWLYVPTNTDRKNTSLKKINISEWSNVIQKVLLDYDGDLEDGNPILTPDILKLMGKLECILTEPGGCVLIGGKVGVGRKTALKIIAKRHGAIVVSPKIGDKYPENSFRNDLKNAMQLSGINGDKCFFFLEDYQLNETFILNMVNCVVSSGEVPGLYSPEELSSLISSLKTTATEDNYEGSLSQYFKERVCENFHLVISFDIDNKSFIEQFRKNPVLYNYCYLIITEPFSESAMTMIPNELLLRRSQLKELPDESKPVIKALCLMHKRAEQIKNVSPFSFFILIKTFIRLNKMKESALQTRKKQLQAGVSKINEAQNIVEDLRREAHEQESLLQEKQTKSKTVLDQISLTMANASKQKSEMEELRRKTEEENKILQNRKQEIDSELAEIEPILNEARAAVGNIKPESITEIRSLRAPTTVIRDILEAVLRLMGIQDTSWNSMKTFLSQRGVRDEIRFFDASQITREDREAVKNIIKSKSDSFVPSNAKRASLAAAPLAAWVTANVQYSTVLEKIRPLTNEQNKLERNIQDADLKIDELGNELMSVDNIVSQLQERLKESTKEAAEIEIHLKGAQKRIIAAEELVKRLSDEFKIWVKEHNEITDTLKDLWKTCMLASAFLTYLSDTSENNRSTILENWKEDLGIKTEFNLQTFLSSDHELMTWSHEGLPSDEFSIQNGITTLNSSVPALLLDPLSVAGSWLKNHFNKNNITLISHHSANCMGLLELSIRFGKIVLFEIGGTIPCVIMPILQQNFVYQGTRKMIYIGEKLVDYNQNFRLFLLAHDYKTDIFSDIILPCPLINFKTSKVGLSEQLLDCALHVEKPTLEKQRLGYIEEEEGLKLRLHQMQEDLLEKLAHAQGDILQNQDLLNSLEVTKESSNGIKRTLNESSLLKENLNKERDLYRPLADYGAKLCFACMNLSTLNELYQISISSFKKLFENSLQNNQIVDSMVMKCKNLLYLVYDYVSRSLLKKDILTFALHLTHEMCPEKYQPKEWEVFIGTLLGDTKNNLISEDDIPTWIEPDRVSHILYLQQCLPELYNKLNIKSDSYWLDFVHNQEPQPPNNMNLSEFQFLLIIQALRPDKLYDNIVDFVLKSLGLKYIHPSTLKLNKLYLDTVSHEPILIICSPGNDPSKDISALAASNKIINVQEFAAGPGCEEQILALLNDLSKKGHWIILKNLHLIAYWLPVLEKEFSSLQPHENFRLWLFTEPYKNFPSGFLSICLKITYETPPGIKRNMERIYDNWIVQNRTGINENACKIMFILAWLHSILQERRTYIPQGWTSFYEFNDADLECGRDTINRLFSNVFSNGINWNYLQGLYNISIYGGRIHNVYDLRVLSSYLQLFFKKDLVENPNYQIASGIRIPRSSNLKDHLSIIRSLPENDNPDFFGLPKNVNVIWQREACLYTLDQLKALGKGSTQEEACNFEEQYSSVFSIINHWKKLNVTNTLMKASQQEIEESYSPMGSFFNAEKAFGISLVSYINDSLMRIEESIMKGQFLQDSILQMATEINNQQVPEKWDKVWSGPSNPLLYLQSVVSRTESICYLCNKWMNENNVIDLAQLLNVDRFFASLKQQASRFLNKSIEKLNLNATIGLSSASILEGSVIITGLLIEGASISYNRLTENSVDSSSISVVPNILLCWQEEDHERNELSAVSIPLYLTDRRDKVVAELSIPCEASEKEKWILSGTAFCIRS